MTHEQWLEEAVRMAEDHVRSGGGPFAAILVKDGKKVSAGVNTVEADSDPSAHAEMSAIREACRSAGTADLTGYVLYASGEPCPMCLGVSYLSNISEIRYACSKEEAGLAVGFPDKAAGYFSDRQLPPEDRRVPFIHVPVNNRLAPFSAWAETTGDV